MKQSQYEITYLIDPQLSEEDRGALETSIDDQITKLEGALQSSTPTLRKKLAYDIKRNNSAFLKVSNIELNPAHVAELQDFLQREAKVIRFTILATPARTRISQEILAKYSKHADKDKPKKPEQKKAPQAPASMKEVTMQDVEKGIEDALTEEVK
jgi:ribosomal protein S6